MKDAYVFTERNDLIKAYFEKGSACIDDAKILYDNVESNGSDDILLVHGIELLLITFLLLEDKDINSISDIYPKYKHSYQKLFNRCLQVDKKKILEESWPLSEYIEFLAENYYKDSIEARYPNSIKKFVRYSNTIEVIQKKLVRRIEKMIDFRFDIDNFEPLTVSPALETFDVDSQDV